MTTKSSNGKSSQKPKNQNSISTGDVSGIGNVIGNESRSNVTITQNTNALDRDRNNKRAISREQKLWVQIVSFLLTFAGTIAVIMIFLQISQPIDGRTLLLLVLSSLIVALGVSGLIKPQAMFDLVNKIIGKL